MTIRAALFAPLLITGGTQRHLQEVLRLLDRRRFAVTVYTLRSGGEVEPELLSGGVEVRSLALGSSLLTPRTAGVLAAAAWRLRRDRIDVVHGYQWRPALVGALAARLAGVPLVLASKRSLTGDDPTARRAWRWIGRLVDTILVNAEALRAEAIADGVHARWMVLRNGIDVTRFRAVGAGAEAKRALGLDPARPVVGSVGRLEARKGHDRLLEALGALSAGANGSAPQLLLVGDGPLREGLQAQARALGVDGAVHFVGRLEDVRPALAAMDVFVLPSREEGMSNALLEAMAAGRPVVATDVGGNGEIVRAGQTGLLVRADDGAALATALTRLLGDQDCAARFGRAGFEDAQAKFDARGMVDRLETFYEERLRERGRVP
jgi:glycosyltransferase involved in cell wall biosynthesis